MLDWFRSWHGAPTDAKWLVIAKRAGVAPGVVSAIVWALLDHASQNDDRGDVTGFDFETYAAFSGFEEEQVRAIYLALQAKGIIVDGRIAQWEKRQPKREDASSERVRALRKRAEPQPALPLEQPRQEQSTPAAAAEATVPDDPVPVVMASSGVPTSEAMDLADKIAVEAGHNLKFVPPAWCGAASRVQVWLNAGWCPHLILQSVTAQMTRKRDGPPDRIQYFEKGIASALARNANPLPIVKLVEPEVIHARASSGGSAGGFASLALDLARKAREDPSERGARGLRVIDGHDHS